MWLLGRLAPDYKSIAEFRRMHSEGVTRAGAELVRMARQVGLVRGEWVAIDGSKFRAVSSSGAVREREALKHYLEQLEDADEQDEVTIDPSAVAAALEKLSSDPEPEARFMCMTTWHAPAYSVQTGVDAAHGIIMTHEATTEATDNRSLLPMAEAAKQGSAIRRRSTWWPTQATPMASSPSVANRKVSCRICPPIAPSTFKGMARYSTASCLSTTRRRTLSAVLQIRP